MWRRSGPVLQRLYDWRMALPRTPLERAKLSVADRLLRLVRAFGDPLVQYPIASFPLLFPLSHRQPWHVRASPEHSRNLGRIAGHVLEKYPALAVIDIGANVGDTIAILRSAGSFPILSVEGDASYFEVLRLNAAAFADVELAQVFVGDADAVVRGDVVRQDGTARIRPDSASSDQINLHPLSRVVLKYPRFAGAKLLKTDTDGLDGAILRGARDFLTAARPVLFFEYEPGFLAAQGDDGLSLFSYLAGLNYRRLMLYDDLGYLMFACRVSDAQILAHMHLYLNSDGRGHYCDLCAFPEEDTDLFERIRQAEMAYFAARSKCGPYPRGHEITRLRQGT